MKSLKKKNLWLNTIGIALLVKSVFGIIVLEKQTNIHSRLNQNNKVRFAVGKLCHSRQLARRLSAKKSSTRPAKTTDTIKESRRHPVDTKRTSCHHEVQTIFQGFHDQPSHTVFVGAGDG